MNINELPIHVRSSKPITSALWFGHSKPNMKVFLAPFVKYINILSEEGIKCNINGKMRNLHVYALCCCVDSPARAMMQGIQQFNGYYGCSWCFHPGEPVMHVVRSTIKYPLQENPVQKRTEKESLELIEGTVVRGFKEASSLLDLKKFDVIQGFVPDEMHCFPLGVVKQISDMWFGSKKKPYSLTKDEITLIDNYIKNYKVPTNLCRLSRSIQFRRFWKAKEWENWLLYYSGPALKEIPRFKKYLKHWELLVDAIHILMRSKISTEELTKAHTLLSDFVYYCEQYYTRDSMTYNVHQLLHLTESVKNWEPLWSHFGYPFESGNGYIVKTVHAAKGVISQICRYLNMNQSVTALQKQIISEKNGSPIIKFCNELDSIHTNKSYKLQNNRYFGRPMSVDSHFIEILHLSDKSRGYNKMIRNKCVYKSKNMMCSRSDNSFIITQDGRYFRIVQFIVDSGNHKELTICENILMQNISMHGCESI